MKKKILLFRATIWCFYGIAAFWIIFAILWLFRDSDYRYYYTVFALGNAAVLAILGYYMNKRLKWAYWGALSILGVNILLTITDQMGWIDFTYLFVAMVLFIMVMNTDKEFKKK